MNIDGIHAAAIANRPGLLLLFRFYFIPTQLIDLFESQSDILIENDIVHARKEPNRAGFGTILVQKRKLVFKDPETD